MTTISRLAAFSFFVAAILCSLVAAEEPQSAEKPKAPFTISKETTYLTEPLRADGRVDYVAAINKIYSKDVTPENNAVVLILEALGPEFLGSNNRDENFKMLGIDPLPDKGEYFIPYENYRDAVHNDKDESEEEAWKDPTKRQDLLDKYYRTMENPWTAKEYPLYAGWLKVNQEPLDKVLEATKRPKYYAPMISGDDEYAAMITVLLPIVQETRTCARLLMAHAMYSIGEGNTEDARRDILACHRLGRLAGQGATLVDELVGIALDGMACRAEVLLAQSGKLNAQELAAFAEELKKLPPMPKMIEKIDTGERFMFLDCVEMMPTKGIESISALTGGGSRKKDEPTAAFLKSKLATANDWDAILRMGNAWYDRIVKAADKPSYLERKKAWKSIDEEIRQQAKDVKSFKSVGNSLMEGESIRTILSKKMGTVLLGLLTPALGAVNQAETRGAMYSDMSQIALALEAYRSDNGKYPERLADLAPKYLSAVPKDPFADADFIYRHEENGYLFYSVGYNGKDDHGKSQYNDLPDETGDDFVIRTPMQAK